MTSCFKRTRLNKLSQKRKDFKITNLSSTDAGKPADRLPAVRVSFIAIAFAAAARLTLNHAKRSPCRHATAETTDGL
jgi:hypothetical protein